MGALGSKLRSVQGGSVAFKCPGCGESHIIHIGDGPGPRWTWNGDAEKPTFTPSVLVRTGHFVPGHEKDECWCSYNEAHPDDPDPFKCVTCHSFVTNGQIQFLGDCTHALAGQTAPLPDFDSPIVE